MITNGFVLVPTWLLDRNPTGTALRVYTGLARYGTYTGDRYTGCRPAVATLADDLHMDRTTVHRALTELVDAGAVIRHRRYAAGGAGQLPSTYDVVVGQVTGPDPDQVPAEPPPIIEPPAPGELPDPDAGGMCGAGATGGVAPAPHDLETYTKKEPSRGDAARHRVIGDDDGNLRPGQGGAVLGVWVDYLAGGGVKLPEQMRARWGAEFKRLCDERFPLSVLRQALAYTARHNLACRPASFAAVVVQVQTGDPTRPRYAVESAAPARPDRGQECPRHPGKPADVCGLCASERMAGGVDPYALPAVAS